VDHFSEGARLQGRFVVEGLGVGLIRHGLQIRASGEKVKPQNRITAKLQNCKTA